MANNNFLNSKTVIISGNVNEDKVREVLENNGIGVVDVYNTNDWVKCNEAFDIAYRNLYERIFVKYKRDFSVVFSSIYTRDLLDEYNITKIEQLILMYVKSELTWQEEMELRNIDTAYILNEILKDKEQGEDYDKELTVLLDMQIRKSMSGDYFWDREAILAEIKTSING